MERTGIRYATLIDRSLLVDPSKSPKKLFVRDTYQLPNGEPAYWDYVDTPGSVMVLPLLSSETFVMLRQYRPTLGEYVLEFPSGGADVVKTMDAAQRTECIVNAAKLELEQETGYVAHSLDHIGTYYVLPSETDRRLDIFVATSIEWKKDPPHDGDFERYLELKVRIVSIEDALVSAFQGKALHDDELNLDLKITGLETVCALLLARSLLRS